MEQEAAAVDTKTSGETKQQQQQKQEEQTAVENGINKTLSFFENFWSRRIEGIIDKASEILESSSEMLSNPQLVAGDTSTSPSQGTFQNAKPPPVSSEIVYETPVKVLLQSHASSSESPSASIQVLRAKGQLTVEFQQEFAKMEGEIVFERERRSDAEKKLHAATNELQQLYSKNAELTALVERLREENKKSAKTAQGMLAEAKDQIQHLLTERDVREKQLEELNQDMIASTKILESFQQKTPQATKKNSTSNNNYEEFAKRVKNFLENRNKKLVFEVLKAQANDNTKKSSDAAAAAKEEETTTT